MSNVLQYLQNLLDNQSNMVVVVFVFAFAISLFSIPIILNLARSRSYFDRPNGRNSHSENTPTLGGIAIFAGIMISLLFADVDTIKGFNYLIAALTIIFFIGIKDDVSSISFSKKLFGQIVVVFILVLLGDIRFSGLYGFLGIYEIPYFISVFISAFVFIVMINGINLIDGVDGLASGLSILIAGVFLLFFYSEGAVGYFLLSISLLGSLIPFFIFNVMGKKNKLFMGDTGALIIGVISVVLVVEFNELSLSNNGNFVISAAPAMSIAIFFIPLYDTLQVFTFRILNRKSPFNPDKNHLHHRLIRLGLTHIQTSLILILFNALVIIGSYFMQFVGILVLSFLILLIGILFSILLWYLFQQTKTHSALQLKK